MNDALGAAANRDGSASLRAHYDFIVVGAGAAGSVLAAELSASGAQVLVIESGGVDGTARHRQRRHRSADF
jgi:choline dehydrogenase-like flavoprotein